MIKLYVIPTVKYTVFFIYVRVTVVNNNVKATVFFVV